MHSVMQRTLAMDLCRVWNATNGKNSVQGCVKHSCLWLGPVPVCLYRLVSEPTTHHARTKGFSRISSPSNVSGPCPVTTVAPSSSVYRRCLIDRTIVAWSPPHKSVRPTPRRNKVSPAINSLASDVNVV